jgi:excisionase family DNA binding protein
MADKFVPARDIARQLSCSVETVRRMAREGQIPAIKVRGGWRADPSKVVLALSQGAHPGNQSGG